MRRYWQRYPQLTGAATLIVLAAVIMPLSWWLANHPSPGSLAATFVLALLWFKLTSLIGDAANRQSRRNEEEGL